MAQKSPDDGLPTVEELRVEAIRKVKGTRRYTSGTFDRLDYPLFRLWPLIQMWHEIYGTGANETEE